MHSGFPRYLTEMAHEAGYDAFMTGFVFLKLVAYLDKTRNPAKYAAIEAQRLVETEAKAQEEEQRQREMQPKVDADGWEISEDEDQDNDDSNWNTQEDEIYHYGSVRVDLANKDGNMDKVLDATSNKASLVRTAFDCFDFEAPEVISNQSNTILVKYSPGTPFDMAVAESLFLGYGKFIIEPNDACSSFVTFERYRQDPATIQVDNDAYTIVPVAEYLSSTS